MNAHTTNALTVTDGFDAAAHDQTASPIRGMNLKFKDAAYYSFDDEIDVHGKGYVVLDRYDGWQKLAKDTPPAYLMQQLGEPKPPQPHVEEKDWPLDFNGNPVHPWKWTHYLRLMDEASGEFLTFWTNTVGGDIGIGQLSDQVAEMRRLQPGAMPVVALQSRDMPTSYGGTKPRPHFHILHWKMRDAAASQQLLPPQEQLRTVAEPSLKEKMGGDEVPDHPFDDPFDIDVPKASAPSVQHKPAAQKPPINKKGVQKIAGARR
jgi:hypothetical protein